MPDADTTYYKNLISGLIDDVIVAETKTSAWDAAADVVATFNGGKVGRIPSITVGGLGDYSTSTGYSAGSAVCNFADVTLDYDRSTKVVLDSVHSIQDAAGIPTAGRVLGNIIREKVVPEVDLCRVAAVATAMTGVSGHIATGYTPAVGTLVTKLEEGIEAILDSTGNDQCNILFNSKYASKLRGSTEISKNLDVSSADGSADQRMLSLDGCPITFCPSARMKSAVTNTSGVIAPATGAKEVVAVISLPDTIQGVISRNVSKILDADQSEDYDGAIVALRLYHGCFVPANRKQGVYVLLT